MGSLSNLYISQSYQSLIHLGTNNTASATLIGLEDGLGNSIGVSVNTAGNLFLSGTFSASLQEGYLYVGNSSGRTIAFPTSSLVTNINTGSLVTTSSFNAYTASTNIRLSNIELTTASVLISINNINTFTSSANIRLNNLETTSASVNVSIANINSTTASQATSISNLNTSASLALTTASLSGQTLTFTKGDNSTFGIILPDVSGSDITALNQFTASQLNINTGYNTFTSSANQRLGSLETTSASVNTSISALNTFTASQSTASLVTSITELNTFSASAKISISALNTNSASVNTSISNLNSFTQSQAAVNVLLAGEIDALEAKTGSYATTGSNTFIGNQTITGNISAFSASFTYLQTVFETASVIYSSGSNQFGDELTDIQTLSGSVKVQGSLTVNGTPVLTSSVDISGLTTTASFNAYTQSNDQRVSSLETNSGSVNVSISNLNSFTSSQLTQNSNLGTYTGSVNTFITSSAMRLDLIEDFTQSAEISITNINSATASLFTSASLALVTASASGNTITFTKGNSSTFSVSVDTGSAATTIFEVVFTGENITKGDPLYISGSQGANPIVYKADAADANKMPVTFISNETIGVSNTTNAIILGLIEGINLTGYVAGQSIYVAEGGGYSTSLPSGSNSITQLLGVITKEGAGGKGLVLNPGPAQLPGLDNGYMWAGNSNNQPIEITTASFASSASFNSYTSSNDQRVSSLEANSASVNTSITNINSFTQSANVSISALNAATASYVTETESGSFLITASFDNGTRNLTFTKGDTTTFNLGGFATTGSNVFSGTETLQDAAGNFTSLHPISGGFYVVARGSNSASAHISSSNASLAAANGLTNIVFKTNNNTADTILSGSSNIFTNTGNPTAGFKRYLTAGNMSLMGGLPQISGSMQFSPTITGNILAYSIATANPITIRGPISSSAYTINTNLLLNGALNLGTSAANNFQQAVNGVSITNNLIGGTFGLVANRTRLTQVVSIGGNQIQGAATFNMNSSSIDASTSLFYGTNTFTNNSSGSSRVSAAGNAVGIYQSGFFGVNGMTFSGSNDPNDVQDLDYQGGIYRSLIVGSNSPFVLTGPTGSNSLSNTGIIGNNLIVTGSSGNPVFGGITTGHGSLFAGRFNADGTKNRSAENVFVVGTGTSTTARKTGFLIDSGSNTFIEGTLNVSGASTLNGNTIITGSLTLSSSAAIELDVIGNSQFTGSLTVSGSTIVTGSLSLSNVISFAQLDPLPTGADGQLAVSASNLWFYSGSAWNRVAFA